MRIFIVDDSSTSVLYLQTILQVAGFSDLHVASTAENALEQLLAMSREGKPADLVLMDISMPGMDGIEATRLIKSHPELSDIQVVMVTASDENEALEQAFEAGATDFITKPVHRVELRARVRSALRLKQEMDKRKIREKELENLTRQLTQLSNQDGLTQVANRRYFDETYKKEYRRTQREKNHLSVLLLDIDFFKEYNDAYGHLMGDLCLKKVAGAIALMVNRPGDLVARFGGEEFIVLLPDTSHKGALAIAGDIQLAIRDLGLEHNSSRISPFLTLSIGIATYDPENPPRSPHELLSKADQALYKAKGQGRNAIVSAEEFRVSP